MIKPVREPRANIYALPKNGVPGYVLIQVSQYRYCIAEYDGNTLMDGGKCATYSLVSKPLLQLNAVDLLNTLMQERKEVIKCGS